jgi:hypothetical protein
VRTAPAGQEIHDFQQDVFLLLGYRTAQGLHSGKDSFFRLPVPAQIPDEHADGLQRLVVARAAVQYPDDFVVFTQHHAPATTFRSKHRGIFRPIFEQSNQMTGPAADRTIHRRRGTGRAGQDTRKLEEIAFAHPTENSIVAKAGFSMSANLGCWD